MIFFLRIYPELSTKISFFRVLRDFFVRITLSSAEKVITIYTSYTVFNAVCMLGKRLGVSAENVILTYQVSITYSSFQAELENMIRYKKLVQFYKEVTEKSLSL